MYLYISVVFALFLTIAGFLAFMRSGKKQENVIFFLLCITSSIWTLVYSLIEAPDSIATVDLLNKIAYAMGMFVLYFAVAFTYYYPKHLSTKSLRIFSVFTIVMFALSFSSLTAGEVTRVDSEYVFGYGPLIVAYAGTMFYGMILIAKNFIENRKTTGIGQKQKNSTKLVLIGYVGSLFLGSLTAVVIPSIFPDSGIDSIAPLSLTFLILTTFVAMSRYKLFDIKAAIAVGVAYLFSTLMLVLLYVVIALAIQAFVFSGVEQTKEQFIASVIVTVILVLVYPRVKDVFNRATSRVFFRDAYDPQTFLGDLNRTLVTDTEIESLLTKSALVIQENLKTSFCTFYIRETSYFPARFIGAHRSDPEIKELELLSSISQKMHKKIHSIELEPNSEDERNLNKVLKINDIEVMARLVNTLDYEIAGIGLIFIGPKKSGSLYTIQDLKILEIIANELVIAIENVLRFEEIEQFNVTLQKKIDDATKELKESNEKLKALDEAKDEFVSMASHQLRTPLTSIKGYISMVLEGDAGKITDIQKQMLGQAFFSSQRMVYLISDLLNVSRLKTGKFVIEPKPVYLPDVVESEITQLNEGAIAKNLTLAFVKPKKFPTISLDEMKTRQVIMNFTDNALYYTPNGGKITIELKDKGKSIEFTVKDNGIGVPKAEQHKLFAKFYRAENARKARPDGTGLGLFMAQKVIIAQGGAIIFESKEGKGSTFGFSFPKAKLLVTETPQVQSK